MADYCSVCGKKIGLLSSKYKSEGGSIICSSCLKEHKMKQEELKRQEDLKRQEELRKQKEKNREIMKEYVAKYLANKDVKNLGYILRFCDVDYSEGWTLAIEEWKVDWEGNYELLLKDAESSKKRGLSGSELDVISRTIKMCEESLDFFDDFEKMYKLFKKKGIETDYSEILSNFSEEIREILNKEGYAIMELSYDSTVLLDSHCYYIYEAFDLKPVYEAISAKLGTNVTEENVIKEFIKMVPEIGNRGTEHAEILNIEEIVSTLLDKFNLTYEEGEVEKWIEKKGEEIEIEDFEQKLGASPQKQKIKV